MLLYKGGSGIDFEQAIIIEGADNESDGVAAEYQYLSDHYGKRGVDWERGMQSLIEQGGRQYDILTISLRDGRNITVYFDITNFYGKQKGIIS